DRTYRPNLTTKLFDCKGRPLAELHAEENRSRILPASEIPANMKHAIVAIEDERFYQHYGVDLVGISRAMVKNVQAGKVVQGASTLTQQLVKNAFLSSEKTLKRKVTEAMLAFQLERKYSKDEILNLYLNEIYFGHGAYGLDSAAKVYFGKEAKDLTLLECATLAGIPKSPVAYSPHKYPENNRMRRELVLSKMVELGFISPSEYETVRKQNPTLIPLVQERFQAPYFVTHVRDILLEKYGANLVYNGGLKIYTTIDLDYQKYAEDAMANAEIMKNRPIEKDPNMNGSLVCIDHRNGHIKAMWGGRDFEHSQFNRVTQAYRQPGSSFKPFVYGCAIENGLLPGDTVVDEPISFTNPWSGKVWAPKNYDLKFHGTVTFIKAIANSFNVPAVKLIDRYSAARVIRFAHKCGLTSPMQPNLSLALGSGNFTPLEMCSAFGVFANQGIRVTPMAITRIEDRDGNVLEETVPQAQEVMKAAHAAMLTDMLRTAVERGTGKRAMVKGHVVAGKTGTTNNYIDAWFTGFTPELVCTVQFGYDQPKPLGGKSAGGTVSAPVWNAFMSKVLNDYPSSEFPVPEGCARIKVCMLSGKPASKSCPGAVVVPQVYPLEAIPKIECPYHAGGGRFEVTEDGEVEFAQGPLAMVAPVDNTEDFFRDDFRKAEATSGAKNPTAETGGDAATDEEEYEGSGIGPDDAATDEEDEAAAYGAGSAGPPKVQVDDEPREPGVVMKPNVEFKEDFE
ncbi:MAG TPA: penicillin-binding protein 1A, partial [Candidatus Ozemobacteraceae bacterium]|nr:penicillin-binding protein 1A [Candidatus Ozemobacteraceae bacterium]